MKSYELAKLGVKHARNAFAEELYLRTGRDITLPVSIYGEVVERCNYKCRYCDYWRRPNYRDEMSVEQWQAALADLKSFVGEFHIEFSGGEPYVKKGFLDIARFCADNGVHWGVTTNGGAYKNKKIVEQTVAARPFNINISIDSRQPELHNYSRGVDNSLSDILEGLANLVAEKRRQNVDFPVIIKPVVHRLNFRELPDMVYWAREIGGAAVNFQPVELDGYDVDVDKSLWIQEEDHADLRRVLDRLIEMKREGAPILNSEMLLDMMPAHFRREKAPREALPCRIGMRTFFIRSDGRVEMCWNFPAIGNVKTQTAAEIWRGPEGSARRKETIDCETLCLFTCLSQKTLGNKVKMGLALLAGKSAA
jgi:MoaA/NifB/PqqE/SkfB family radical SAM enzyme